MSAKISFLYVTYPNQKSAQILTLKLLNGKHIACANMFSNMKSFFWWNNKITSNKEVTLIYKTQTKKVKMVKDFIIKNHPYDTPCVAEIPIKSINLKYEKWLLSSLG